MRRIGSWLGRVLLHGIASSTSIGWWWWWIVSLHISLLCRLLNSIQQTKYKVTNKYAFNILLTAVVMVVMATVGAATGVVPTTCVVVVREAAPAANAP